MSLPNETPDAPCRDRGHQQRDQHVVAGQRQAEEAPLHSVPADRLHGVETLQQVAGAAEIPDRAAAVGRPLPKTPFDTGMITTEPGIAERGEGEKGEARNQHGAGGIPGGGERHQRTERDRQIIGVALLETERTGTDIQHQLKEPRARQRRRRNDSDRQGCRERGVGIMARMRRTCAGIKRHVHLLYESVLSRAGDAVEAKRHHAGVFYSVDDVETVHPTPAGSGCCHACSRAKPFGQPASALRVKLIRGLTGSHRPLYSAGVATSAFRRAWRKAPVAGLVEALDSKSSYERSAGSIPARGTKASYERR